MYFVVISQQGPSWDPSKTMRDQQLWTEHATFINGLVDEGFLLLGGPLADRSRPDDDFSPVSEPVGDDRLYRTMVVVQAPGSDEAAARLTEDPWIRSGVLVSTSIDRWEVLVGDPAAAASDA
jgi:uncharacterized protein YciI